MAPIADRDTPQSFRKRFAGSTDTDFLQDDRGVMGIRVGGSGAQQDFDIPDNEGGTWDLVGDGDFVIPDEIDALDSTPNIGGTSALVVCVESTDDNVFDVSLQVKDDNDNTTVELNSDKDPSFSASNPSDANAFIWEAYAVPGDLVQITLTDTSNAAQNTIRGSINAH